MLVGEGLDLRKLFITATLFLGTLVVPISAHATNVPACTTGATTPAAVLAEIQNCSFTGANLTGVQLAGLLTDITNLSITGPGVVNPGLIGNLGYYATSSSNISPLVLGLNVLNALQINLGNNVGALLTNGGPAGRPSSIDLTNAFGLPINSLPNMAFGGVIGALSPGPTVQLNQTDLTSLINPATTSVLGSVKPDGTTITISAGTISARPTTINGVTCTPGGSCTPSAGLSPGATTISGGTNGDLEYNNSGILGESTLSAFLDTNFGSAQGDVLYRGASGWTTLAPGTSGFALITQGASANPTWAAISGGSGCTSGGSAGNLLTSNGSGACTTVTVSSLVNGALSLGSSGTAGSVAMGNATSGTITLVPTTGALGTVTATLPANTGTLAELNLAQAWTATQTFTTPVVNFATGGSSTITLDSSNTGFTNTLGVKNSGTSSNTSTLATIQAQLSCSNCSLFATLTGAASPTALLGSGLGITGGLTVEALAGALTLNGATGVNFAGGTITSAVWNGTAITNTFIATPSMTINGTTCTLGSSCAPTAAGTSITVGTTTLVSGTTNGLIYNNSGVVGNLTTVNNGVLVTSGAGVPSISTTLPNGLAYGIPASVTLTNASGLPTTGLSNGALPVGVTINNANWSGTALNISNLAQNSLTIGSTAITLGTTASSIAGLTSLTTTALVTPSLPGLTTAVLGSPAAGLDMSGCTTRATCSWYVYSAPTNWTANGNGDMMQISRVNPSTGSGAAGGVYSVLAVNGYTGASESSTMYAMPVTVQDNRTSTGSDVAIPVASIMNKNGGAHAEGIYWQQQDNVASTNPTVGVVAEGDVYRARGSTTDANNVEWALNLNGGSAQCLSTPINPAPPGPCDATSIAVHIGALLVFSPQNGSTVDVGILFGAGFYGGDYVNGIDFRPGAYFGFPLIGNGFSVNPSGNAVFNALNLNGLGAVPATTHLCIAVTKVVGTC